MAFTIDPTQFVAPQNSKDPPRRQVTVVTLNKDTFSAQAIAMEGGVVGFYDDAAPTGATLLIVQRDNTARLSRQPQGVVLAGRCTPANPLYRVVTP